MSARKDPWSGNEKPSPLPEIVNANDPIMMEALESADAAGHVPVSKRRPPSFKGVFHDKADWDKLRRIEALAETGNFPVWWQGFFGVVIRGETSHVWDNLYDILSEQWAHDAYKAGAAAGETFLHSLLRQREQESAREEVTDAVRNRNQ